jgi:NADPH:quinone reductase-like Zn-dependent oxidoreductase
MISRARQIVGNGVLGQVEAVAVREPGPGEALLRVHATSVNYHDLVGIDGGIPNLPVPRVPFSDASATVVAIGDGVTSVALGDPVIPGFFRHWQSGPPNKDAQSVVLGDQVDGTLQSHLVVPAQSLARAPAGLTHGERATLGCAGLTAWRSIVVEAGIRPGQTVVVQGTGGVSLFALGFAKMLGARVILTSSSDAKLERAGAFGADVLINYGTTPDWARAVMVATGGHGADLVVEVGGGATLGQAVRATRVGGHISIIGVLTGRSASDFPLNVVMSRNITMRGVTVGSTSDLAAMCRAIEQHGYRPVIDQMFDLESAHEAVEALRAQTHFGKIAVRIDVG